MATRTRVSACGEVFERMHDKYALQAMEAHERKCDRCKYLKAPPPPRDDRPWKKAPKPASAPETRETNTTGYTPNTGQVRNAYGAHMGDCHKVTSTALEEFDRWHADEIRKAKAEARAEALTKARVHLDRIAPNGLISKADVLADLDLWADRATRGIQPNGNPYRDES